MAKRTKFEKADGEIMDAARVREFAGNVATRMAQISAILFQAADLMDKAAPDATINATVSQFPELLRGLEERSIKQLRNKAQTQAELAASEARSQKKI